MSPQRTGWFHLPSEARNAVQEHTGQVLGARSADVGVMSALASMLDTRDGPVFVKGTPADSPSAWVYRHEARVTAVAPLAPPVLWQTEGGGWLLYGYGALTGRHPDFAPNSPDLRLLVHALSVVSARPWPDGIGKKSLSDRLARFVPAGGEGAFDGRMLVHTDAGEFNLLVTGSGMRLLDWALACPGPDWADAALLVPRLIATGHTPEQADRWARRVPAYRTADPDRLAVFARTVHAFWRSRTLEDPLPQRVKLTQAAEQWAGTAGQIG
ncbi:phosphotransferase [Kitasatospora sp. NPDC001603]|uniref:phosphotransferase n=1 Tax=Kitasatospora sp. NPDC001603 TaxID=3154388 RepID=UPI003334727A